MLKLKIRMNLPEAREKSGKSLKRLVTFLLVLSLTTIIFHTGCLKKEAELKRKEREKEKSQEETTPQPFKEEASLQPSDFVELTFEPNPVQPNKALTIKVKIKNPPDKKALVSGPFASLYKKSRKVWVNIPGASSASHTSLPIEEPVPGLEGTYFWYKANDQAELKPLGVNEWSIDCIAPTDESLYFPRVLIKSGEKEKILENRRWILKVFPEWWEKKPSFKTPEEATRADLNEGLGKDLKVDFEIKKIEERKLLPDDRRDNRFLKLYMIAFVLFKETPVLPQGENVQFFYVLKESPEGNWKVLSSGSSP